MATTRKKLKLLMPTTAKRSDGTRLSRFGSLRIGASKKTATLRIRKRDRSSLHGRNFKGQAVLKTPQSGGAAGQSTSGSSLTFSKLNIS